MDENENTRVDESSTGQVKQEETKVDIDNEDCTKNDNNETAGPSGNLPGSIPKVLQKTGLSKSEHHIRIITCNDLANALKLTSMSFGQSGQSNRRITNLNIPDLKYSPKEDKNETFVDIKKFMASCFQTCDVPKDVVIPLTAIPKNPADSSIKTETNEIVVTKEMDLKSTEEKKKNSASLSERSELGLGPRDSLSSIGSNVCRICMTRGRERLISPCNCKGSLANVHLSCLERWLNQVGRNHCELCGYSYPAIRTPRYTVLQGLRLWFGNPRNRGHLQSDCLIFWLLSTVTAGLLAVCVVGTQYFVVEGNKFGKQRLKQAEEGIPHRVTETAMDFFMAIVLCGYTVTVYLLWKDHFVMWNRWRRANVNVRLLLSPESNPVPFVPRGYHVV